MVEKLWLANQNALKWAKQIFFIGLESGYVMIAFLVKTLPNVNTEWRCILVTYIKAAVSPFSIIGYFLLQKLSAATKCFIVLVPEQEVFVEK